MKRLLHTAALGILLSMTVACQADADKSAAAAPATSTAADSVTVEAPFVRAIPPGQPNSASFMTLVNTSDSDHSVKSAASPVAATVELHTHTNNNGVMEMRQVPQIDVPAKGRTELKPGGLHVMLIGLQQELKVGETAAITLTFEDGSTTTVNAPIQEVMPAKH
ncbi:copper chaperone PCu(A)C [Thiothrix subterranea]|uniref:copper chaperone PCu(A)C n=1 Tax=Thiothrix subterranea TaxID=2735563 RepID=UPI00192B53DD|nr:copper chaperone PCu(A)C [Thiothrix subterranea]QQZ28592.1 copper chaperone PCu(A)C [Thiothrix subterranea]